ncbi:hypothetical protein FHX74_003487 [Friedmanniella endophytica]|uniref:Lon N-terminal domain-containing protein n=1 Tax=Microlunatus kandeliicorticis TaxID=1759536 RepID=A0A7W3IV52_9ACTN|nr:LON peptidase substrate-binding domain-containing protein [Microlunatus kandeliicorticis]MBA8795846.1 hypothetical protein [Microlunatus kandeliicorticis]
MTVLPMFPLGSVLYPTMPLGLRVFEPRYLQMMLEMLDRQETEFGVVLIERGFEVGGGDHRFDHGTVARIQTLQPGPDSLEMLAVGQDRIVVEEWLEEVPYPKARVRRLEPLGWDDAWRPVLETTERTVRRCLAEASEFTDLGYPADIELDDDPRSRCWQLAGIIPAGPLDAYRLLRADNLRALCEEVAEQATAGVELLRIAAAEPPEPPEG